MTATEAVARLELRRDLLARVHGLRWPDPEDLEAVAEVLATRAALLAEVAQLGEVPKGDALSTLPGWVQARARSLVEEMRRLVREVVARDGEVRATLERDRDRVLGALGRVGRGRRALRGYGRVAGWGRRRRERRA